MTDKALDLFANQVILGDDLCDSSSGALFPMLSQGNKSPIFRTVDGDTGVLDGDTKIDGVYLAHRFSFVGYPVGYNGGKGDQEQDGPIFTAAAPAGGELATLVKEAAAACQFCPVAERSKFDVTEDNAVGHLKASIEILLYNAELDTCVVIRSSNHYKAVYPGDRTIGKLYRHKVKGILKPVPLTFQGVESEGYRKPLMWIDSTLIDENSELAAGWENFKESITDSMKDDIDTWRKCLDNSLDEEFIVNLKNIAELGKKD